MGPLQDIGVERPEKLFEIELILFGTTARPAVRRTIKVLAQTAKGAKRICSLRYRRSEIRSARKVGDARAGISLPLFGEAPATHAFHS